VGSTCIPKYAISRCVPEKSLLQLLSSEILIRTNASDLNSPRRQPGTTFKNSSSLSHPPVDHLNCNVDARHARQRRRPKYGTTAHPAQKRTQRRALGFPSASSDPEPLLSLLGCRCRTQHAPRLPSGLQAVLLTKAACPAAVSPPASLFAVGPTRARPLRPARTRRRGHFRGAKVRVAGESACPPATTSRHSSSRAACVSSFNCSVFAALIQQTTLYASSCSTKVPKLPHRNNRQSTTYCAH